MTRYRAILRNTASFTARVRQSHSVSLKEIERWSQATLEGLEDREKYDAKVEVYEVSEKLVEILAIPRPEKVKEMVEELKLVCPRGHNGDNGKGLRCSICGEMKQ
jgi:hypothetical protein